MQKKPAKTSLKIVTPLRSWMHPLVVLTFICCQLHAQATDPKPNLPVSSLAGNWALTDSLPDAWDTDTAVRDKLHRAPGTGSDVVMTASVDVVGNQINALVVAAIICPSSGRGGGGGGFVSGTIDAEGHFVLRTPEVSAITTTIEGSVPTDRSSGWDGKFSMSYEARTGCSGTLAGEFHARPMPLLSGRFSGNTKVWRPDNTYLPADIVVTLNQLTNLIASPTTVPATTILGISRAQISFDSPSFHLSGVSDDVRISGTQITATFSTSDGMKLLMEGAIISMDSTKLSLRFIPLSDDHTSKLAYPAVFSRIEK